MFKTISAALLLLSLLCFFPFNVSATVVNEPVYGNYSVDLTHFLVSNGQVVDEITTYPGGAPIVTVRIDAVDKLPSGTVLENAYVTIKLDRYSLVDKFELDTAGSLIKSHSLAQDAATDTATLTVVLNDINALTRGTFNYFVSMRDGRVPKGYLLKPTASLHLQDGSLISSSDQPNIYANYSDTRYQKRIYYVDKFDYSDNRIVIGGSADDTGSFLETTKDVVFDFYVEPQGNNVRSAFNDNEKLIITDTLPTYIDKDGTTRYAHFDPAKNTGWILSEDGKTVTRTVINTGTGPIKDFTNSIRLLLSFPDIKLAKESIRNPSDPHKFVDAFTSGLLNNQSTIEIFPFNGELVDPVNKLAYKISDNINFKVHGSPLVGSFLFTKKAALTYPYYEIGYNHTHTFTYTITYSNTSDMPMNSIIITDDPLDNNLFIKSFTVPYNSAERVVGIKEDGTEDVLWVNTGSSNPTRFWPELANMDLLQSNVQQVKAGTLAPEASKITRVYRGFKIEFKPSYVLQNNRKIDIKVSTALVDPYGLQVHPLRYDFHFENKASMESKIQLTPDTTVDARYQSEDSATLHIMYEYFRFFKPYGQHALFENAEAEWTIQVDHSEMMRGREFRNAKIVDFLPEGLTFVKMTQAPTFGTSQPVTAEVFDNYLGSGKQAVVFTLPPYYKAANSMDYNIGVQNVKYTTRVNGKAAEEWEPDWKEKNTNLVYFVADGWVPNPPGVHMYNPQRSDVYDLDNDGNTTELINSATNYFSARLTEELRGDKSIRANEGDPWNKYWVDIGYDDPFQYKLTIKNGSPTPLAVGRIYERLPFAGDTYGTAPDNNLSPRGSEFPVTLTGPISVQSSAAGYKVYYHTSKSLPATAAEAIGSTGWVEDLGGNINWADVTAVYVDFQDIPAKSITDVILNVKSPAYDSKQPLHGKVANNTTSMTYGTVYGESNLVAARLGTTFPVTKDWSNTPVDKREAVTVQLLQNGTPLDRKTITLSEENQWNALFENLPFYDTMNEPYVYTIEEVPLSEDFESTIAGDTLEGFTITNKYLVVVHPDISFPVTKDWSNTPVVKREAVTVQLLRSGTPLDGETITLSEENQWKASFENLPSHDMLDEPYVYTVEEVPLSEDFESTIAGDTLEGFTITNKYLVTPPTPKPSYKRLSVPLTASKTLLNATLKGGEFTFTLKDGSGKVAAEATNQADGRIVFPDRTFSRTGTFLYTIEEKAADNTQYTYDAAVYQVAITTSAKTEDTLQYTMAISKNGSPFDGDIHFTNKAHLPPTGDSKPLEALLLLSLATAVLGAALLMKKKKVV